MYILQQRCRDGKYYNTKSYGKLVQAETITELVQMVIDFEFNPDELNTTRVIKRTEIPPVVNYKDEVV